LVITDNTDKEMIKNGIYNILVVSKELLKQKLENDLFPIGQMLKEAKALINGSYLKELKINVTKKNVKWYIETTKEKLKLIDKVLVKSKDKIDSRIIYTLILRIRTLYIIQKLIKNQVYSSKEFSELIAKLSGSKNAYLAYLAVKNDYEEANLVTKEEAEKFILKSSLMKLKECLIRK